MMRVESRPGRRDGFLLPVTPSGHRAFEDPPQPFESKGEIIPKKCVFAVAGASQIAYMESLN